MTFSASVTASNPHIVMMTRRMIRPMSFHQNQTMIQRSAVKLNLPRYYSSCTISSPVLSSFVKYDAVKKNSSCSATTTIFGQQLQQQRHESSSSSVPVTEEQVRAMFTLWNDALQTGDSKIVAKRYSKNPILLPTVSDTPRTDYDTIKDYFDNFLKSKPSGQIVDGKITIGQDWAMDAGVYEFTLGATNQKVMARYSFVYVLEDDTTWRIAHHHSSVMPEGIVTGQSITKEEVQGLFHLWNDALATLDAKVVADRYSKTPCLLPTVSDQPRTDYATIEDYFVNFLKAKPQGVILESNTYLGTNWAQDAGIYEFTLGATGAKVKARYTFIYVYEDGQWKIQHHHSSVMPEGIVGPPQPITEGEVRSLFSLWNNALATLDADEVAKRYSKQPVLLPTVSNTPRTDYNLIKDYFTNFLKSKPQGEIVSGDIIIGHNWAQDAGIYDFTMGANGSKVRARYSFIYVYEDGEWKISHHHSSVMPEG